MKFSKKILLLIILYIYSSCYRQKEIRAIGFAYKGDNIILHTEQDIQLSINVNGVEDENRICSFNKKIRLYNEKKDTKLTIVIDSSNIKVLDTFVIIPKNYKEPFISFIYPSMETKYRRKIFIADETDSSFHKE